MQFGSVYWFLYPWTHFKVNFLLSKQQKGSLSKPETSIARKSRGGGGGTFPLFGYQGGKRRFFSLEQYKVSLMAQE